MTLTVEDGTGLAAADSYNSLSEFESYAEAYGLTLSSADDELREAALRRGFVYINTAYATRWPGTAVKGRGQAGAWPRRYAYDASGNLIPSDEVPREVKQAHNEAAVRELTTPGSLTPDASGATRVIQETVGPISVRYSDKGDPADAARPTVTLIDEILAPVLTGAGTSVRQLMRA